MAAVDLLLFHFVSRRYCYEERSDRLWSEIKYVLETFAQPLTDLFKGTLQLILVREGEGTIDGQKFSL